MPHESRRSGCHSASNVNTTAAIGSAGERLGVAAGIGPDILATAPQPSLADRTAVRLRTSRPFGAQSSESSGALSAPAADDDAFPLALVTNFHRRSRRAEPEDLVVASAFVDGEA